MAERLLPATLAVEHWHAQSSDHRPACTVELEAGPAGDGASTVLRGRATVRGDRFVRTLVRERHHGAVCEDSCVELFLEPVSGHGYFNLEMTAAGSFLASHVQDPRRDRATGALAAHRPLAPAEMDAISVTGSLAHGLDGTSTDEVSWTVAFELPLAVLARAYAASGVTAVDADRVARPAPGDVWRGNFYKCADGSSRPHWGSWAPVGAELNFHVPEHFAPLRWE